MIIILPCTIQVKRFAPLYKSGHSHTFFITSYIFELSLVLLLFLHLQTAANSSYVRTSLAIKAILTLIMLVHNLTDSCRLLTFKCYVLYP